MADDHCKRQYADESGKYILPNDGPEHDRLDAQSRGLIALMHNQPFHVPPTGPRPKRILDVGCGTGAMTHLLAIAFPEAEVIGVDISPVPERHERVPNLTYVQGDVMELASAGEDERFRAGSFDYVFHRLLVLGVTDWPGYVARVATLLGPGGWAEMQDYDMSVYSADGANISEAWWHWACFREDTRAMGLDMDVGRKLGGLLHDAGLVDVEEKKYVVPCVWSEDLAEHERPMAKFMNDLISDNGYARALLTRSSGPRRSEEELERMIRDCQEHYADVKPGDHLKFGVAFGRKSG